MLSVHRCFLRQLLYMSLDNQIQWVLVKEVWGSNHKSWYYLQCLGVYCCRHQDCVDHEVHLQWIPSHVDIYGKEVANNLAKQGTAEPLCSTPSLTFDEIYSIRINKDLKTRRVPPCHDWYKRSSPGGSIDLACDRADQTTLSRFVSGHLRSCSFSHGNKVFPVCAKCGVASASPEHILSCLRLSRVTFETDPLIALDFLRVSGLMDGV
ncbi:hypothetical protein AVEN_225902-1 [Araneus ventricosus]|uniref:RNase H type-1 domain-containing protein n=1 Tax=Araneus ventricosus TaxID=182803 RepID=A0A4Y2BBF8_ARAVE|nr:hypothetical protein AVEN_225902-1 [Araneus ventricosus]